jgi:hypothetical protein
MKPHSIRKLASVGLTVSAILFGSIVTQAETHYVTTDPGLYTWNGYWNAFGTNGALYQQAYLGAGSSFDNQSSIDGSGTVTCSPDIHADLNFPYDTTIWYDDSGSSTGIANIVSTFYADVSTFAAGDTVIFSGSLLTNGLAAPYTNNVVVFIKGYDSGWGFQGIQSVHLNTLTNDQQFTVTWPSVAATGDHIQWGVEWSGPPARLATVAGLGFAMVSTNGGTVSPPPPPKTVNVSIDHNQFWGAYQTCSAGGIYSANYLGAATEDIQGTISSSDVVRCAPDVRMDKNFHTDTTIWADDTGLSDANPFLTVDSTYYVDTGAIAVNGDTVIFSGQVVSNLLTEPYASSVVAFIKDFDSGWGLHGMVTMPLIAYANGDVFSLSKVIAGDGSHVQYGFEWVAPPARTNPAASSYVGNLGYVLVTNKLVLDVAGISAINPNPAEAKIGSNVTFTAVTTGSSLTYQWSKDGVALADGPGVSGAKTNVLTLSSVQGTSEGTYTLVVTDPSSNKATASSKLYVYNPAWLYYDRAFAPFNGYINVWNGAKLISSPPSSGDAGTSPTASFGFGVNPTTLVRASMNTSNDVITLQPNTYVYDNATNSMDPAYINPDGSSAAYLEQDYYIVNNSLASDTLVFAGYCSSNSLDSKYTARAWIKVSQDWSVENRYDTNLVAGQPFILTVPASATTNKSFVQYGFAIWGPCNSSTNPITQGACEVKVYSPLAATHASGGIDLGFPTVWNHDYTVQYKTNLTDSTWINFSTNSGTGAKITAPDSTGAANRFYRLWIQ